MTFKNTTCYYVFEPRFRGDGYTVSYVYDLRDGARPGLDLVSDSGRKYKTSQEAYDGFYKAASDHGVVFDCRKLYRNCLDILNQDPPDENTIMVSICNSSPYAYRLDGLTGHDLFVAVAERFIKIIELFPLPESGVWNFDRSHVGLHQIAYRSGGQTVRDEFDRYLELRKEEETVVYRAELKDLTNEQVSHINEWVETLEHDVLGERISCSWSGRQGPCEYCQKVLDHFIQANPTYFAPTLVEQALSIVEQQIQEAEQRGYARGHEQGVSDGNSGYERLHAGDYQCGFTKGYYEGRDLGDEEGYDRGYSDGVNETNHNISRLLGKIIDNM